MHYNPSHPNYGQQTIPYFRNYFWENWGLKGILTGVPLAILGFSISISEIVRIIYGVTQRGINNYYSNGNPLFSQGNDALLWPVNNNNFAMRAEKFHYWPWSYAANLFGLVAIFAGVTGIITSYRRSYSSIFAYLTLCLLSALLGGYLIGYFSVLVNYYKSNGWDITFNRPQTMDTTYALIGTNLAFSCGIVVLSVLGFIFSFCGIRAFSPKGLHLEGQQRPFVEPFTPKGQVVRKSF